MQNLQALTVFFPIDFGWGCCAPSDLDPTPEIKGSRGRRRCSPEMANPAFPCPVWTAAWLWSMHVACVSHWDTQRGAAGLGAWSSAMMAALGGEVSPEQAVRGSPGGYGLQKPAQRGGRRF